MVSAATNFVEFRPDGCNWFWVLKEHVQPPCVGQIVVVDDTKLCVQHAMSYLFQELKRVEYGD